MRARPGTLLLIVAVGLALHLPSLGTGFYADDYLHQLVLEGETPMGPFSLFDFGGTEDWRDVEGVGSFPWWTSPDWRVRFFRPLTSASLWLDHAVFGGWALGYHLTSLALYALLLLLAFATYRSFGVSARAAHMGVALLAASSATLIPVGWTANRNTLLEVLFMLAAVCAAARSDTMGRGRSLALALVLATAAALCKESGVLAFVLVALCLRIRSRSDGSDDARRWADRAGVACLLLAVSFVAFLVAAGYGTDSMFYATPWRDPVRYATGLAVIVPAGALALVSPFTTDVLMMAPHLVPAVVAVAVVLVAPLVWWVARRTRGEPSAKFFGAWVVLAILLQGAAPPGDRLLLGPAVATSVFLGMFLESVLRGPAPPTRSERVGAWVVALSAGVGSGLGLLGQGIAVSAMANEVRETILTAEVGSPEDGPREVFVLQAHNALAPFAMATTWAVEREDHDLHISVLQLGRRGLEWAREDDATFVLTSLDEPFLTNPFEYVYRSESDRLVVGTTRRSVGFVVETVAVDDDGGLRSMRVRFDEPLGPRHRFLVARDDRLVAIAPPSPGESVRIEAVVPPNPFTP